MRTLAQVDGCIDDVAEHRRRRRVAARTSAVEHQGSRRFAFNRYRIERLAHSRQRVLHVHHRRVHPNAHCPAVRVAFGDTEQLDDVTELLGHGDVAGGKTRNPLAGYVVGNHVNAEREIGDDRDLRGGVVAFDIGGGVGFGVSQLLCAAQRRRKEKVSA